MICSQVINTFGFFIVFNFVIISFAINANENNLIKRLKTELFKNRNYDPTILPMRNQTNSVNITISWSLINIVDLDINRGDLTTEGWLQFMWHDDSLMWNETEFGDLKVIRVGSNEIFLPDIMLYNAVDYETNRGGLIKTNALIYSSGSIMWVPPTRMRSGCKVNLEKWPFDEQTCFLKLGSWTYDGYVMDVWPNNDNIDLSDYWPNSEWDIIYSNVTRTEKYYPCCTEPYPDLSYFLTLRRKPSLYNYIILVPVIIAVILSLITFWFPLRSTIRFVLSGFSLIIITMILLYLANKLGFGSTKTPYAIRFVSLTALLIAISLIWSTIAYNLSLLRCRVPSIAMKKQSPGAKVLHNNAEHETYGLTQSENKYDGKNLTSEPNLEAVITVTDKIVFAVYLISLCLVHM